MATLSVTSLAKEWDDVRSAFASSILVDTALTSLAQNLDGVDWPLRGENETPAAYIDFEYPELAQSLTERGHPEAAELIVAILRDTLAFDQPFGEMVAQTQVAADRDNPLRRSLQRLGISEAFPLELTLLDETSRQLCRLEQVWTLGEFAALAQRLAQSAIVGGDLRQLLNALIHTDEQTLARLLPFRVGKTGVHLAEALGQACRTEHPADQVTRATTWFAEELATWRTGAATNRRYVARELAVLGDDALERRAHALILPYLAPAAARTGLWSIVTRWFRR